MGDFSLIHQDDRYAEVVQDIQRVGWLIDLAKGGETAQSFGPAALLRIPISRLPEHWRVLRPGLVAGCHLEQLIRLVQLALPEQRHGFGNFAPLLRAQTQGVQTGGLLLQGDFLLLLRQELPAGLALFQPQFGGNHDASHQRGDDHSRGGEHNLVSPDQLLQIIQSAGRARGDRLAVKKPSHIQSQAVGRLIAPAPVFFQRPHDQPIQVALQFSAQPGRIHLTPLRHGGQIGFRQRL